MSKKRRTAKGRPPLYIRLEQSRRDRGLLPKNEIEAPRPEAIKAKDVERALLEKKLEPAKSQGFLNKLFKRKGAPNEA